MISVVWKIVQLVSHDWKTDVPCFYCCSMPRLVDHSIRTTNTMVSSYKRMRHLSNVAKRQRYIKHLHEQAMKSSDEPERMLMVSFAEQQLFFHKVWRRKTRMKLSTVASFWWRADGSLSRFRTSAVVGTLPYQHGYNLSSSRSLTVVRSSCDWDSSHKSAGNS